MRLKWNCHSCGKVNIKLYNPVVLNANEPDKILGLCRCGTEVELCITFFTVVNYVCECSKSIKDEDE